MSGINIYLGMMSARRNEAFEFGIYRRVEVYDQSKFGKWDMC